MLDEAVKIKVWMKMIILLWKNLKNDDLQKGRNIASPILDMSSFNSDLVWFKLSFKNKFIAHSICQGLD